MDVLDTIDAKSTAKGWLYQHFRFCILQPPMPFDNFRNVLSFRRRNSAPEAWVSNTSTSTNKLAANVSDSWHSTCPDFVRLRYFVWTGEDPGFTLTTDGDELDDSYTDENADLMVERVTSLNVWEAGVRPGNVLEAVANKRVDTMDTEAAIVLVQMATAPSIVRFSSSTVTKRVRFDVLLSRQKLGVSFTGDGVHDVPVVTRVPSRFGVKNQSSSGIQLGDVLVAVNGMDAIAAGLEATMKYVTSCLRPLRLTFERAANDPADFKSIQAPNEQSGVHYGSSFALRSAIPNAVSSMKARAAAHLRCTEFLQTVMPAGAHSLPPQLQQSDNRADTIWVEWKTGPLGVSLVEDAISGATLVNRLTGKGSAANVEHLQHGFQLYSINGQRTEGRRLKEVCRDLETLPKPVQLVFLPPHFDSTSENGDSSSTGDPFPSPPLSPNNYSPGLDADSHRALVAQGNTQQSAHPPLHEQQEYEVLWTSARLELQLRIPGHNQVKKPNTAAFDRYPSIHKILKKCTLDLPEDAVGDMLVSVNNWRTAGQDTSELRGLLRAATKPALLRFRRQESWPGFQLTVLSNSSRTSNEGFLSSSLGAAYSILWTEGKLGITFGCYEDADRRNALVVYVKSIGDGQARMSKMVSVGDVLCSLNGKELPSKQKFKKTVRSLVSTKQPVTLGFRRLLVECSANWNT